MCTLCNGTGVVDVPSEHRHFTFGLSVVPCECTDPEAELDKED